VRRSGGKGSSQTRTRMLAARMMTSTRVVLDKEISPPPSRRDSSESIGRRDSTESIEGRAVSINQSESRDTTPKHLAPTSRDSRLSSTCPHHLPPPHLLLPPYACARQPSHRQDGTELQASSCCARALQSSALSSRPLPGPFLKGRERVWQRKSRDDTCLHAAAQASCGQSNQLAFESLAST
jgi:hypothetical protein